MNLNSARPSADLGFEFSDVVENASPYALSGDFGEEPLDEVEPGAGHNMVTIKDRRLCGDLTIRETWELEVVSRFRFHEDRAGRVALRRNGNKGLVPGPIAARYVANEPIDDLLATLPGLECRVR
jgi:hypothetical protein